MCSRFVNCSKPLELNSFKDKIKYKSDNHDLRTKKTKRNLHKLQLRFKNQYPLYMDFFFSQANYYKDVYITNYFIYGDFETDAVSTFVKHETILYFYSTGLPNIQNTEQKIFLSQERAMQVISPF